jgi:rhodanese-related sulfurtransferase
MFLASFNVGRVVVLAKIVKVLELHKGLTNLHNLEGGINAWAQAIDTTLEQY